MVEAQVWISFPVFVAGGWCRDQSKKRRNIATCSPDKGRAYSSSRDNPRGRSLDDCEGNPQWRVSRSLRLDPDLHRLDERQHRLFQGYCWPIKVSEIPNERVPCQQAQTSHHSEEVRQGMVRLSSFGWRTTMYHRSMYELKPSLCVKAPCIMFNSA